MNEHPLKKRLGEKIRELLRGAKIRNLTVAEKLNITNSAVSQMLSGLLVPSMKQLEEMLDLADADYTTGRELRDLVTQIRVGTTPQTAFAGERLRIFRERRGLTTTQLANICGVDGAMLRMWEDGISFPDYDTLLRLCDILGCRPEVFKNCMGTEKAFEAAEKSPAYDAGPRGKWLVAQADSRQLREAMEAGDFMLAIRRLPNPFPVQVNGDLPLIKVEFPGAELSMPENIHVEILAGMPGDAPEGGLYLCGATGEPFRLITEIPTRPVKILLPVLHCRLTAQG